MGEGVSMKYKVVKTNSGLEIRSESGTVVWGPSQSWSWPPNEEMVRCIFDDSGVSQPQRDVLLFMMGFQDIKDETGNEKIQDTDI
jgi:hypothetical protein